MRAAQNAYRTLAAQYAPASFISKMRGPKGTSRSRRYSVESADNAACTCTPVLPIVACSPSTPASTSANRDSGQCMAATTVAATLLLPPWISRATVYLSSLHGSGAAEDDAAAPHVREVAELCAMAVLQDLSVATAAFLMVMLPGLVLTANASTANRAPVKMMMFLFSLVAYMMLVAPVWFDLLSQLLMGIRVRYEYITLTLRNFNMLVTSLESFQSSLYDMRAVALLVAAVLCCTMFIRAVHTLGLAYSCVSARSRSKSKGSIPSTPSSSDSISAPTHARLVTSINRKRSFRLLRRRSLRYCARPLGLLLGLSSLYTLINLAVVASLMVARTSTSSALRASNAVFLIGAEALRVSYLDPMADGFLLPSSVDISLEKDSSPSFFAPSERFFDRDAKYPFYRRTLGYTGPKAFDIKRLPNKRYPNIVMIMLETWRHKDVGVLGGAERLRNRNRTATPNFDRLSQQGILFDNFHANGVQTSRTLMSTLFGTLPQFTTAAAIDSPSAPTLNMSGLPSLLKKMGYSTLFASATELSYQGWNKFLPAHGFDQLMGLDAFEARWRSLHNSTEGFNQTTVRRLLRMQEGYSDSIDVDKQYDDGYENTFEKQELPPFMEDDFTDDFDEDFDYSYSDHSRLDDQPERTSWGLSDNLSFRILANEICNLSSSEQPFFIEFYSISSHHPFEVPWTYQAPAWTLEEAGGNEDYRRYLEVLSFSDKAFGDFFDQIEQNGLRVMNETIFVVGGDHGFGFCEHKPCYDGMNIGNANAKIYDEVVRVPLLIVSGSNLIPEYYRGKVVHEAASQVDILATVMDMVGVPAGGFPQHGVGRSLMRKSPIGVDKAVLQNTFNDMAMGQKVGDVKYIFEGSRLITVYNMSVSGVGGSDESIPAYSHRMEEVGDALVGAPKHTLDVRQYVAKLLHRTTHCYQTNTFIPPTEAGVMIKNDSLSKSTYQPDS